MKSNMNEEILKSFLDNKMDELEKQKNDLEEYEIEKSILEDIILSISVDDYDEVLNNTKALWFQLPLIYDKNISYKIIDKLYDVLYNIKAYKKIYDENDLEEEQEYQNSIKKFNSIKTMFKKRKNDVEKQINYINNICNKYTLKQLKRIVNSLEYEQIINSEQIEVLSKMLFSSNFEIKDQIIAMELIKIHNINIKNKLSKVPSISETSILDMLNVEFYSFDKPYIDDLRKRKEYDIETKTLKVLVEQSDDENDMEEIIVKPSEIDEYDEEKFDYIMIKNIIQLEEKLNEFIELIKEREFYMDEECAEEITINYNNTKRKYDKLIDIYIKEKSNMQKKDVEKEKLPTINNIFYASNSSNSKSYLEQDLENIAEENLDKVRYLINGLRTDKLNPLERKNITNNNKYKECLELKKDQIRVIYKHINNNNYLIIGVATKKDNNDMTLLTKMAKRNSYIDISTRENLAREMVKSEEIKGKVLLYIENNKRKGSR